MAFDLRATVAELAGPLGTRTEADVQAAVRDVLVHGDLNLDDLQVRLEVPAPGRRRIDVEVGFAVIEIKKNLAVGNVLADGEEQLAGYVRDRTHELAQRYVGVLTDGRTWRLYHWIDEKLVFVQELKLKADGSEVLLAWLDGVLATQENITPTPTEVARRLGAESSAFELERSTLESLWKASANQPACVLKRELWSRLLHTALGTKFEDRDRLFVEHTYLVLSAKIIAHAVLGFDISSTATSARELATGGTFATSQIAGVVDDDFFDWVLDAPEGERFVQDLARRLNRFEWHNVEHDVLKVLYESVIGVEQRKKLGEYYTPDWLTERMVMEVHTDPLNQRALDPSCGSGTFLFHMVRNYLEAADAAGLDVASALTGVTTHIYGMDVHPVAVTLARVTYLLAIGQQRLQDDHRPPLSIPVFLGDSVRWRDEAGYLTQGQGVTINAIDPDGMISGLGDQLYFPDGVVDNVEVFDQLVAELSTRASNRTPGSGIPSVDATFNRLGVADGDRAALRDTFAAMCRLHDDGRDHIWGYYARNTARPYWLSSKDSTKVDLLIGNVPWLASEHMSAEMFKTFKARSQEFKIWAGGQKAAHQDLAAYFVLRCIDLYLRKDGDFFLLMPLGVITRTQYEGFRSGKYETANGSLLVDFGQAWDLHAVRPPIFPMPSAAVRGRKKG